MKIECETIHVAVKLVEILMDDQISFNEEDYKHISIRETQGCVTGKPRFDVCFNENDQEK